MPKSQPHSLENVEERIKTEGRVFFIAPGIIYVRELSQPTLAGVSESAAAIREMTADLDQFCILVEFPEPPIPSHEIRHRVIQEVTPIVPKLAHVAVVSGPHPVFRVAQRLIAALSGFHKISFHATRQQAFDSLLKIYST